MAGKVFSHSWTWKHVNLLTLRFAFCQCGNCLISTHFIHHTWRRPDQNAPRSPAGIWGDFEGIRLALSIWRYLLSWSHGGRLSWGSAGTLHSTACYTMEKSTHFTAGVALKCISSATHTVTVSERRKGGIEIQIHSLGSIYINYTCKGFFWQ